MFARLLLSASAAVLFAGAAIVPRAETGSLTAAEADAVVGGRLRGYCCGYKSGCLAGLFLPSDCGDAFEGPCKNGSAKAGETFPSNKACRSDTGTPANAHCEADADTICKFEHTCKWNPVIGCTVEEVNAVLGGNCGEGDAPCIEVIIIDILIPSLPFLP